MTQKPLYKYEHDGMTTVSPIKPAQDYTEMVRVIADEGMILQLADGTLTPCVDVETCEGITEIEDTEREVERDEIIRE
jgi:hypothetical protein